MLYQKGAYCIDPLCMARFSLDIMLHITYKRANFVGVQY